MAGMRTGTSMIRLEGQAVETEPPFRCGSGEDIRGMLRRHSGTSLIECREWQSSFLLP